jgi:ABC-type multidrug transport system fused ATPase/permease subunit
MFTDEQRESMAASLPQESFEAEQVIYSEDEDAENLYLILTGRIQLYVPKDPDDPEAGQLNLGELEAGDLFGLEAIEEGGARITCARALTPVSLGRFNLEFLDAYFEDNSLPYLPLKMMLASLKLFLEVDPGWRNPEEAVVLFARRHPFFLLARIFIPATLFLAAVGSLVALLIAQATGVSLIAIFIGIGALLTGLWAIWVYVDWSNDYAILTSQRVVFQEKVIFLYDSRQETPLDAILATSVDSSQLGRIIGYGDVILKTYTGNLIFSNLALWDTVRLMVDDRRTRARETSQQAEKRVIQSMVRQRLKFDPPRPPQPKPEPAEAPRPSLGEILANLFRMRSEKNGIITYHTHWFLLLTGIFLPTLTVVGLLALAVLQAMGMFAFLDGMAFWPILAVVFLMAVFWLWYRFTDWYNDVYVVSDEQIIDIYKKPLGQEEKRVAPLKSIQSVEFERLGLIGLVLNYGTVFIRIGDTRFTFDRVYNPSEVQRDLFQRIAAQANRERQGQADAERQRILDVLEAYHAVNQARAAQGDAANEPPPVRGDGA